MAELGLTLGIVPVDGPDLETAIARELAAVLNRVIYGGYLVAVRTFVHDYVRQAINNSPEAQDIINGKLHGELGLVNPAEAVTEVINGILKHIQVEPRRVVATGSSLAGGVLVQVLRTDLNDVLTIPLATFESTSVKRGTVTTVPWLDWLLRGGNLVLADYFFLPGDRSHSRTRLGIMVPSKIGWGPSMSGTQDDNWLTRALVGCGPAIGNFMVAELVRRLGSGS